MPRGDRLLEQRESFANHRLRAVRPSVEIFRLDRFRRESGIIVVARQCVVHRAGDRAEFPRIVDELVRWLAIRFRRREVLLAAFERIAPRIRRTDDELLHHRRDGRAISILETRFAEQLRRVLEAGARREEASDFDIGMNAGSERAEQLDDRAITDDDRRVALLGRTDPRRPRIESDRRDWLGDPAHAVAVRVCAMR